jgi:prophage regulatory protein
MTPTTTDTILRLPAVLARVGVSRRTLYELMKTGRFPAALKLSPGAVGWRSSDVDRWIAERQAR